ncbi:ABC transporter permease [Salinadaptatus halalkaliphilus]|uniref:ABC transporter permease n=1 Tax=Salinadaptatus halalkaliphilus TaxID=2419781 RepID=A0A4S3TLH8_9EURY|nr:ABC transporter permease [Salinadaptatus halalkaliphilus]THE65012.1 ABC transporter permease [Salinadaptatus halalkaliphilus]
MDGSDSRRRTRWVGIVSLAVARLWRRAMHTRSGRIAATVTVVAVTIGLLVTVTGVSLALADGGAVSDDDGDITVTPAESATLSAVDGVEGPRLGDTNARTETIADADGVDHASPVLVEPGQLEAATEGEERRTVLLVGVVPDDEPRTVAGLPTDDLEPGDSHYGDGSYDGPPNGEIVLSAAAADRLEAEEGDELAVPAMEGATGSGDVSLTVAAVDDASDDETPVALVHLSELQSVGGAADGQLADRVVVWGDDDAASAAASEAYPDAAVDSGATANPASLFDDGLAFAASLLALLVGVVICTSFVATTAGMTVEDDRQSLAVLESVGIEQRGRLAIVAISTLVTTICGAVVGIVLGFAGIYAVNAVAGATIAPGLVAHSHPAFVPYALVVAVLSGLIAMPYPLVLAAKTSVLEEVSR